MPNPDSYYQNGPTTVRIRADVVTVAEQAGFAIDSYDREVIFSRQLWRGAPGLGTMNKRTIFMSEDNFNLPYVSAHELGHSFGWRHANFWEVSGGSPISSNGTEIEYGDVYDMMGNNIGIGQSWAVCRALPSFQSVAEIPGGLAAAGEYFRSCQIGNLYDSSA